MKNLNQRFVYSKLLICPLLLKWSLYSHTAITNPSKTLFQRHNGIYYASYDVSVLIDWREKEGAVKFPTQFYIANSTAERSPIKTTL